MKTCQSANRIRVEIPMSTSNLGSGFDCLALALANYLVIEAEKNPSGYEVIRSETVPELAGICVDDDLIIKGYKSFFRRAGLNPDPVRMKVLTQIPVGKGLGSSAAAIVGGIAVASKLSGITLRREETINLAYQMERHPDNIVAAVMGGFTASILVGDDNVVPYSLPISEEYRIVTAIPDFSVRTEEARNILPIEIPLRHAVYNIGRAVMLAEALRKGSSENLQEFLDDRLHQIYRFPLIRGYEKVKEAALSNGALGVFISGSGSSVAAICLTGIDAVKKGMKEAFASESVVADVISCRIDTGGLRVFDLAPELPEKGEVHVNE